MNKGHSKNCGCIDCITDRMVNDVFGLRYRIRRLEFALKASIEISGMLEENIKELNKTAKTHRLPTLEIIPQPDFIKKALEEQENEE